jgi:hypothetical protein
MAAQLACLPDEVERSEGYRARRSGHTAEGAPLLKDPRSAEQNRAAVEAWEGEGGLGAACREHPIAQGHAQRTLHPQPGTST